MTPRQIERLFERLEEQPRHKERMRLGRDLTVKSHAILRAHVPGAPSYRVHVIPEHEWFRRTGFAPGRVIGLCDRNAHQIFLAAESRDHVASLAHEIAHVSARGHGQRFRAELHRLAAAGVSGADHALADFDRYVIEQPKAQRRARAAVRRMLKAHPFAVRDGGAA